jgi:flagellar biosynthesis protein
MEKKAVALKYDHGKDSAPKVVASGKGFIAQSIIEKAVQFDVPLFQNRELVDSLINLEVEAQIPPILYEAVVEVFAWLMKSEKNLSK